MKALEVKNTIFNGEKEGHLYVEASHGTIVHDVVIDAGIGEEVAIGHISDIHYNYCNKQDFLEADPVIMSTHWHRMHYPAGLSLHLGRYCYELLDDMDQMVFNGDTLDYLSHGTMEMMQMEVWDRFPDAIATVGGHECLRQMQGRVNDPLSYEQRLEILRDFWKHDIYYTSKLLKDRVLVIGMFNDRATFNDYQLECLKKDIALARENGYIVLIFVHEPICTKNPAHAYVEKDSSEVLMAGDFSGFPKDFYAGVTRGVPMAGSDVCDESTKALYEVIVNNADVIRGVFAGHYHSELYVEILAKNPDGSPAIIPQFIKTASALGDAGGLMRILVK